MLYILCYLRKPKTYFVIVYGYWVQCNFLSVYVLLYCAYSCVFAHSHVCEHEFVCNTIVPWMWGQWRVASIVVKCLSQLLFTVYIDKGTLAESGASHFSNCGELACSRDFVSATLNGGIIRRLPLPHGTYMLEIQIRASC